jgi:hypothetical protein
MQSPRFAAILLCLLSMIAPPARTQTLGSPLSLDLLLDSLDANILAYRRTVPNLLCTEKAQSTARMGTVVLSPNLMTPGGPANAPHPSSSEVRQRTESIFRLRRVDEPTALGLFDESRIVQTVNGKKPADNATLASPVLLFGVFSNGLNLVSKDGRACFSFRLHPPKGKQIVVDFRDLPSAQRGAECPPFANTSGRIFVDPQSMHVARIEKRVPRQELVPGVFGPWDWTEDYAPVTLLDKTFWMPKSIRSRGVSEDDAQEWTYEATYLDYHLFHADVRIVP